MNKQDFKNIGVVVLKLALLFLFNFAVLYILARVDVPELNDRSTLRYIPEVNNWIIPLFHLFFHILIFLGSIYFLINLKISKKFSKYLSVFILGIISFSISAYLFLVSLIFSGWGGDIKYHKVKDGGDVYYVTERCIRGIDCEIGFFLYKKNRPFKMLQIGEARPNECYSSSAECEDKIVSRKILFHTNFLSNELIMVYDISENKLYQNKNLIK